MPQMAPISWLMLFFLFSFSFIIFNILNFYCLNNKKIKINFMNKNWISSSIWKW